MVPALPVTGTRLTRSGRTESHTLDTLSSARGRCSERHSESATGARLAIAGTSESTVPTMSRSCASTTRRISGVASTRSAVTRHGSTRLASMAVPREASRQSLRQ